MALHRLMEIDLRGTLNRERLAALRDDLGMQRRGRLTDPLDEEFGYRYLKGPRSADVRLWRRADDRWRIVVTAWPHFRVERPVLEEIARQVRAAAPASGLTVGEVRFLEPPPVPDFATMNRNENWLRTMHWDLPAQSLEELWPVLGLSPSADDDLKRARLRQFMTAPAWEPAPERIRREAEEFLT
jgi:hypothetical protein